MEADRKQLEEHVDVVVRLAKSFFIGQNVKVEDEGVEDGLDVEEIFVAVHVVSHQDYVEVCNCLQH